MDYQFYITMIGRGNTPEEAWADCVEAFTQDPGPTPEEDECQQLPDEEGDE